MDARKKQWDARNKQWKKVVWVCLIVFAAGSVLNTLAEDLYLAAYVSLVGKDGALILGTLTHICFLIPGSGNSDCDPEKRFTLRRVHGQA